MSHRKKILSHYEHRIRPGLDGYEILDWASAASQQARFDVLADQVDLANRSLLDVGCGVGDLWAYLHSAGLAVRYTGVDISEKMIAEARRRHPQAEFLCGDPFADGVLAGQMFDVVFCSGIFNLNLGNNRVFLPQAVGRLMTHVRERLVFNLLHVRAPWQEPTYAYYDPHEVLDTLGAMGLAACMIDDYLPNDFTVVCRHPTA